MAQQKRGLGRGLGALIPTGSAPAGTGPATAPAAGPATGPARTAQEPGLAGPVAQGTDARGSVGGAYFQELPIDAVTPNPRQPRRVFDEETLDELVDSIREVGLLQPVVVRETAPGQYELVMGERRWRATQRAGLTHIPAIVRATGDDDMLRDALMENLHREQLNPLEEAAAYQQLLDDFGATHEELARKVGRSRPHISNTVRLLQLSGPVQKRVAAGVLSAGHARALLSLDDAEAQDHLARRIVAEGLSVRAVEEIVTIGDVRPVKARRPSARQASAPALDRLADRLSDAFDTRVKVELGQRKGKIVVEFGSIEDLERIITTMSPEWAGALSA
ncbi:MAG TPA: ParB/RepB/Spo0J family partition protein [Streptosporangiaceae bacterium]|nr:ParB/RepB/Spo0J family partition protein [Streptosporangiaceae bacterium]